MQPTVMAFATFLKLLTQTTGERIRDLEKYATPGGYDFWRPLRETVEERMLHDVPDDYAVKSIKAKAAPNQEPRNLAVYESFANWRKKQTGIGVMPPKGVWKSPNKVFTVRVEPEIAIQRKNGETLVAAIYGRKAPRISRDDVGAAIIILKQCLGEPTARTYGILDAGADELPARFTKVGTNVSETVLATAVRMIEEQLMKVKGHQ